MSGLEYVGSLAILAVFFYILVNIGSDRDPPDEDLFGWEGEPLKKHRKKKKKRKKRRRRK